MRRDAYCRRTESALVHVVIDTAWTWCGCKTTAMEEVGTHPTCVACIACIARSAERVNA